MPPPQGNENVLSNTPLTKKNISKFIQIEKEKKSYKISLRKCSITSKIFKNIASLELSNLRILHLDDNDIHEFPKKVLPNLEDLSVNFNGIQDKSLKSLVLMFPNLQKLALSHNHITDQGAIILSQLKCLRELNLFSNLIGSVGFVSLVQNITSLRELYLNFNNIGDEGAQGLSDCPHLQLEVLKLDVNKIGSKGLNYLKVVFDKIPSFKYIGVQFNRKPQDPINETLQR